MPHLDNVSHLHPPKMRGLAPGLSPLTAALGPFVSSWPQFLWAQVVTGSLGAVCDGSALFHLLC